MYPYMSPLSLHDALPILSFVNQVQRSFSLGPFACVTVECDCGPTLRQHNSSRYLAHVDRLCRQLEKIVRPTTHRRKQDRKSTRLNSSHLVISYAVFCLKI